MKKIATLFLIVLLGIFWSACQKATYDEQAVQPGVRNIQSPSPGIPLYFKDKYLPYLGVELRDLSETQEQSLEQLAVNELIVGPKGNELQRLIPESTTASVNAVGNTLFVTLSQEFLDTLPGEARNWVGSETERSKVQKRRCMAVYAIVNTITEIGNYSRVQILISDSKTPEGYRPSQYDMGLSAENDGRVTDVLVRNPGAILTPETLTRELLRAIQEKQWETVYNNVSQTSSQSLTPVTVYEFESTAKEAELTLENFSLSPQSLTFTGGTAAIILVHYTIRDAENQVNEFTDIPLRLVLVNHIWKVELDSIQNIILGGKR